MTNGKNPEIEVLRAIAVLFVLFHHQTLLSLGFNPLPVWITQNFSFWSGVDLFFVISGFVITRSLRELLQPDDVSKSLVLKRYALKRVFRLWPAAWLWLAIPLLIGFAVGGSNGYPSPNTLVNDLLAGFFNVANFYYPYCFGAGLVNELCSSPQPVGPYWSLSLEEQFYLVLPVLLLLFRRNMLTVLFAAIIVAGFFWFRPFLGYGWFSRIDALAWGVLLALVSNSRYFLLLASRMPSTRPLRIFVVAILLLLLAWFAHIGETILAATLPSALAPLSRYSINLLALVSAALVFLATLNRGFILADGVALRCLVLIGARSYALYLVHTPLLMLARSAALSWGFEGSAQYAMALCIAIPMIAAATEMTYRYVEVPARNYGATLAARLAVTSNAGGRRSAN